MKYSIRFGSSSIGLLVLKQQEFGVGSLLGINISYCVWKKNTMFNISWSTHSKDPVFGRHTDMLLNFELSGKNLQLESLGKKYSNLIEELAPKIMSSIFQRARLGLHRLQNQLAEGWNIINFKV